MSVFNVLNSAIFSRLSGGTALTTALGGTAIYYQVAPDERALPYVVWSFQSGPTEPQRTRHRDPEALVYVRAYADDAAEAGRIDAHIDSLLHARPLTVTGYTNYWIGRTQSIADVEIDETQFKTYSAGALYDLRLDRTIV